MTRSSLEGVQQANTSWQSNGHVKFDPPAPPAAAVTAQVAPPGSDSARPKGRIRRSMTACNTCRKLKTRCDLDPRSHACRRCLSLRIDCELPDTPDRFLDNAGDPSAAIPCIEERLASLEKSMGELTRMMRQMTDRCSPNLSCSTTSQSSGSFDMEDSTMSDGSPFATFNSKPMHWTREVQSDLFGDLDSLSPTSPPHCLSNIVSKGGIQDSKLSLKLLRLFVEHFGSWVSIDDTSALCPGISQRDPLLFSTACLLASRYIPGIPPAVINGLCVQVRNASSNILWEAPPLKYETLQALTLLCLWSATIQKKIHMDAWVLSGISINHAIISFDFLNRTPGEYIVTDEILKQLRLWNALCLIQLHFAIATSRPLNVQQRYLDHCARILEHPGATLPDGKLVAEIQLYSLTLKLQTNPQRMQFASPENEEIQRWKMDWAHLFTSEQDSTFELNLWFCQLLLHRTALRAQPDNDKRLPELLQNCRLILTKFLRFRPYTALNLIDHVYFIVGQAALALCDYNVLDPLIDQTQAFLLQLAPTEEHLAYRFAYIISEIKRRYIEASSPHPTSAGGIAKTSSSPFLDFATPTAPPPFMPPPTIEPISEGYTSLGQLFADFMPSHALSGTIFPINGGQ